MKPPSSKSLLPLNPKQRKKSLFKKKNIAGHGHVHDVRLQFKELKAYLALVGTITAQKIELPEQLRDFYRLVWTYREINIFDTLCKKYTPDAIQIISLNTEQLWEAQEKIYEFYKTVSATQLSEEARGVVHMLLETTSKLECSDLINGITSFIAQQEELIKHLLKASVVTDVSLHEVRKKIKKGIYLLPQAVILEPIVFKHKLKKYTKLAKKIWERNDINQLITYLDKFPQAGKEAKFLEEMRRKEQKKKTTILEKLRVYFAIDPVEISDATEWVSSEEVAIKKNIQPKKKWVKKPTKTLTKKTTSPSVVKSSPSPKTRSKSKKKIISKKVTKKTSSKKPSSSSSTKPLS